MSVPARGNCELVRPTPKWIQRGRWNNSRQLPFEVVNRRRGGFANRPWRRLALRLGKRLCRFDYTWRPTRPLDGRSQIAPKKLFDWLSTQEMLPCYALQLVGAHLHVVDRAGVDHHRRAGVAMVLAACSRHAYQSADTQILDKRFKLYKQVFRALRPAVPSAAKISSVLMLLLHPSYSPQAERGQSQETKLTCFAARRPACLTLRQFGHQAVQRIF